MFNSPAGIGVCFGEARTLRKKPQATMSISVIAAVCAARHSYCLRQVDGLLKA